MNTHSQLLERIRPARTLGNLVLLVACLTACRALAADPKPHNKPNPFFVFDNGVGRGTLTPVEQARVVKELGFDGISYNTTDDLTNRLAAFDGVGLKIFALYIQGIPGGTPPFEPGLTNALRMLKGRNTIIWLTVQRGRDTQETDEIRLVREVADLAATAGLRVAIYPHRGNAVETVEQALRLAEQTGRTNVGVTFNLCHELMAGNHERLPDLLRRSVPRLFLVSINGADAGTDIPQTIQVLGEGRVDVLSLLQILDQEGYAGPVGLQCYNLKGDPHENLSRSMRAWRQMLGRRFP